MEGETLLSYIEYFLQAKEKQLKDIFTFPIVV